MEKLLMYKLILFWLETQLGEAEASMDSSSVDNLVIATEAIQGALNAFKRHTEEV